MKKRILTLMGLALVLALCLLCGSALAANDQRPVDVENFYAESEEIYMNVLGEFYTEYMKALENPDASEKLAMMALAEAKMLESGVFIPLTSKGGYYAISRVAPKTANTTMWGNDSDRFHNVIVVDTPIKAAERDEMKAKWLELRGTGTYEAWAKEYLTGKGYTISDTYALGYTSDPQTWDSLNTYRAADSEAIVNTYDGLMEYDMENVQQPALAESYTVSEDGLKYTFTIRKGVVWVDNQGREVANLTADDFVAGMQHLRPAVGTLPVDGVARGDDEIGVQVDLGDAPLRAPRQVLVSRAGAAVQHERDPQRVVELGKALEVDMGLALVGAVLGADRDRQRVDAGRAHQLLGRPAAGHSRFTQRFLNTNWLHIFLLLPASLRSFSSVWRRSAALSYYNSAF